jgi:hypothetical protein
MTLFMRNDNIKIIWDVVLMCPLFNELFQTEQSKKEWFNKRINTVEKGLSGKNVTIMDLRSINREAIKLIMSGLKEHYLLVSTDIASRPKPIIIGSDTDTPYMRRQNEYDKMKSVYVPTQIDFRSGEVDQPITNMSELIEKQVNERRKTLDVPSAFLSNNTNNMSWTSNEVATTDSIWKNDDTVDSKVTWTTPVEQEFVLPTQMIQTRDETIDELSLKVDTVLQKLSFITNYLKCSSQFRLPEPSSSVPLQEVKRERSMSL